MTLVLIIAVFLLVVIAMAAAMNAYVNWAVKRPKKMGHDDWGRP